VGNEESKVFGIPLVLVGFVVINALVVIVPVSLMQKFVMDKIDAKVQPVIVKEVIVATPIPTPTMSLAPTKALIGKPTITVPVKSATGSGVKR
jgi:hypothetical protein